MNNSRSSKIEYIHKLRLIYIWSTYFNHLDIAEIFRRLTHEQHSEKNFWPRTNKWNSAVRTAYNYFDKDLSKPNPDKDFILRISELFAKDHEYTNDNQNNIDKTTHQIKDFIFAGYPSPFQILIKKLPAIELGFEYLLPLKTSENSVSSTKNNKNYRNTPFEELRKIQSSPSKLFLRGAPPDNWAVLKHVAIDRKAEEELLKAIYGGDKLIIFTGSAGDGKTTIAKRTAMHLRMDNWRVFYSPTPATQHFPQLPHFPEEDFKTCMIIDRADEAIDYSFLEMDLELNPSLHVILVSRTHTWALKGHRFGRAREIGVLRLSDDEVIKLSTTIAKHEATDENIDAEVIKQRIMESLESEHPHLLAAMLTATHGERFSSIIKGIIEDFIQVGDDWLLRIVALTSWLSDQSSESPGKLSHNTISALLSYKHHSLMHSYENREWVQKKLREISSEIITLRPINGERFYDLRHPDIVHQILSEFYMLNQQDELNSFEMAVDDLSDMGRCEVSYDVSSKHPPLWLKDKTKQRLPYTSKLVIYLLNQAVVTSSFMLWEIARGLTQSLIDTLGNVSQDKYLKTKLMWEWGKAEFRNSDWDKEIDDNGRCPADVVFEMALEENQYAIFNTYDLWITSTKKTNTYTELGDPTPYSPFWLCRKAYKAGNQSAFFMRTWVNNEKGHNNGDFNNPHEYSARWILHEAWKLEVSDSNLLAQWSKIESELGELGEFDAPAAYTARWICREGWKKEIYHSDLFLQWSKIESEHDELGKFDAPAAYTARWICREGWEKKLYYADLCLLWSKIEREHGELGEFDDPALYSARWIYREGWNKKLYYASLCIQWSKFESEHGELGKFDAPAAYTARWIFREGWGKKLYSADLFTQWSKIEIEHGELGEFDAPVPYTSRWICREGWKKEIYHSSLISQWLKIESEHGELGEFDDPALYSARWIYRNGWEKKIQLNLLSWLIYEPKVGAKGGQEKYTCWWIVSQVPEHIKQIAYDILIEKIVSD